MRGGGFRVSVALVCAGCHLLKFDPHIGADAGRGDQPGIHAHGHGLTKPPRRSKLRESLGRTIVYNLFVRTACIFMGVMRIMDDDTHISSSGAFEQCLTDTHRPNNHNGVHPKVKTGGVTLAAVLGHLGGVTS
jgi:hypothetical protein